MRDDFDSTSAILALTGPEVEHFLQGILTQDVAKLTQDKIQFAALLSPQGKILHDMFVVAMGDTVLLDTPAIYKDTLLKCLTMYKLRAKVTISDIPGQWHVAYGTDGLPDPRHPDLPHRSYSKERISQDITDYRNATLDLGIPDSALDFTPDSIVAMDAGYDLLGAISFSKGCYVGQEVTARMHYKNIARKGFYILEQGGKPLRLALLKFEDMKAKGQEIFVDNQTYSARLPQWMEPKIAQFHEGAKNQ